ncbi:hypothetical protein B4U45_22460 [Mycobacterium persicum]|nr:hypothetical protein A4G31_27295 [Mycobacterium persicum]ORB96776.1 hypothetical protein B1T44_22315 [Mycobacterium persicum]ORC03486.1 hypothetical protein B1T48_21890 [Mycobacterium persicum]ORC08941.1 hypothetical protein B4U45_22460 [Mycobacterium persicum]ORC13144.1 hypothetical protein B1T46_22700 [Mycobacterium kansasii]
MMRYLLGVGRRLYGERLLHLIVLLSALALGGYAVSILGLEELFNRRVWWQSIAVWFAVAIIAHDLVLFPLYAMAERLIPARSLPNGAVRHRSVRDILIVNYIRLPTVASGLILLLFLPGIIEQGASTYQMATGLTQAPYFSRWLLLTAGFYLVSAICFVVRVALTKPVAGENVEGDDVRVPVSADGRRTDNPQ